MSDDSQITALVQELEAARAAASRIGGQAVIGVRAVEPRPAERRFLCALDDGTIGCLDHHTNVMSDDAAIRETLRTAMLVEHCEEVLDLAELQVLEQAARKLLPHTDDPAVQHTVSQLATLVARALTWRAAPQRALARLGDLDDAVTLHTAMHRGYLAFVAATDPLVPVQDTLSPAFRDGLRDLELACGGPRINAPLTPALAGALESIDKGVDELIERLWEAAACT